MKKILTLIFILLLPLSIFAQQGYFCVGMDGNFSGFPGSTFSLGIKGETRIKHSDWYMTWHYGVGQTYKADVYTRSSLLLELYNSPDWFTISHNSRDPLGELLMELVFPVLCPTGISSYLYQSPNRRIRAGIYFDVLEREQWEIANKQVDSWSPEVGYKMYYNLRQNMSIYFSVGSSFAVNLASGPRALDADMGHLDVSLGLAHRGAD